MAKKKTKKRKLTARRDIADARDYAYTPRFSAIPNEVFSSYTKLNIPILDQGAEGACTGFGLATAINYYLKLRQSSVVSDPEFLYKSAKKYDEYKGEDYEGSSCRGALKGFSNLGAKTTGKPNVSLGAYIRVNHKNIHEMILALNESGVLYASADVHSGWDSPDKNGYIKYNAKIDGGHAFSLVGYNKDGFWIQNSWGKNYGLDGFCHIGFDDWLANGYDAWMLSLAVF